MPRRTDWVDTIVDLTPASAGQDTVSLLSGLSAADMRGATLIRTILRLGIGSTSVAGVWGVQAVHIAIGIIAQEAFNAGAFPDPNAADDRPSRGWIYRTMVVATQNGAGARIEVVLEADIRGARKIEAGVLFVIAQNKALRGTAFTASVDGLIRVLYKLP